MSEPLIVDPDLAGLVDGFFADRSSHELVSRSEREGLPADLWAETAALGLTAVGSSEEAGGTLLDTVTVLRAAGRHAVPLPLVEHNIAAWLLGAAGLPLPEGPVTLALDPRDEIAVSAAGEVTGTLHAVAWLPGAVQVVTVIDAEEGSRVVVLEREGLQLETSADLAGQPRSTVRLVGVAAAVASVPFTRQDVTTRAMLLRAALIAGAIEGAAALTRRYAGERVQFGKPIGAFQAVQQHVVTLAQMASMSALAVERAAVAAERGDGVLEIVAAKLVVSDNATVSVRASHQAHGAIGMTREYRLQQLTRRLNTWRSEDGAERPLALDLGARAIDGPSLARLIST